MSEFPATKEAFYQLRDDRTNRVAGVPTYAQKACWVTVDQDMLDTFPGQVMLLCACNLLSRWCRRIYVQFADVRLHPLLAKAGQSLGAAVLDQMFDADPFGDFYICESVPAHADLRLHVGSTCSRTVSSTTLISCSVWHGAVCRPGASGLKINESPNCAGALVAAALGVAQVFRDAIGKAGFSPEVLVFDMFRLESQALLGSFPMNQYPADMDVGRVLLVGAGSVGSAAVYCMKLLRLVGNLTIVDGDSIGVENFNRSPIFGKKTFGLNKAQAVAADCAESTIRVSGIPQWWDEFVPVIGRELDAFDAWLPLANERGVRWQMQNQVPPLAIHASTTQNWGVNFGRHIPGRDDCLVDRFPEDAQGQLLKCSSATLTDIPNKQIDAALPFLSFLGGALVAVDLLKLKLPDYPQSPNFVLLDLGGAEFGIQRWDRKPRMGCICKDQAVPFRRIRAQGRYAQLSPRSW